MTQSEFLRGQRINPKPVSGKETVADHVDKSAPISVGAKRAAMVCSFTLLGTKAS